LNGLAVNASYQLISTYIRASKKGQEQGNRKNP